MRGQSMGGHMKWFFAHILPRIHWTSYGEEGNIYLHIWRQWLGFCWDETKVRVGGMSIGAQHGTTQN